jgi:DNA invertase Pin-like site-specific DNA recombinase
MLVVLKPVGQIKPDRVIAPAQRSRVLVVDGYVRSSTKGAWSASRASVQRWQIASWTEARGWRLGHILEEAVSHRPADPAPLLRHALERVESRESDGIVIPTLNQIGTSLTEVLSAIERIQAAGGAFASVCDGIDFSTPTGRLILRLLVSVSEWWPL